MHVITDKDERSHLVATLNEIGTEHVYVILHASDIRMKKVTDHSEEYCSTCWIIHV